LLTAASDGEKISRVTIDPSLALTDEGMALFANEEIARDLAVSKAFYKALRDGVRLSIGRFRIVDRRSASAPRSADGSAAPPARGAVDREVLR
jgi:hypothetical protein